MTGNWDVAPGQIFQPDNPNIDHTLPPITTVDGPAQPIVRIPVVGPAPFNTLAIVRGRAWIGEGPISDGRMHHRTSLVSTHLTIPGFDPGRPVLEQVRHSTSATILAISSGAQRGIENDDGSEFVIAVDAVHEEARIADDGRFSVAIDTANSHYQTSSADFLEMTSWVLYHDPDAKALDEQVWLSDWMIELLNRFADREHLKGLGESEGTSHARFRRTRKGGRGDGRDPFTGEIEDAPPT